MAETSTGFSAGTLFSVKNWVAVVTGGGTGIGLMAAQALAGNGAKVYITGRRKEILEKTAQIHGANGLGKDQIIPLPMDVTSKESIKNAVEEIKKHERYVNVLINSAGIGTGRAQAKAADGADIYGEAMWNESIEDDWSAAYLTNCTSLYFVTSAFLPLLAQAKSSVSRVPGNVVNISSISGITKWSQNGQYSYNCSKAAVNHLTRMMACELCHENTSIRVNAIAPGYFPSELTTNSLDADNSSSWDQAAFEKEMKRVGAKAHRPGTPQEMAKAILSLATNEYLWGAILVVDGGLLLRHPSSM